MSVWEDQWEIESYVHLEWVVVFVSVREWDRSMVMVIQLYAILVGKWLVIRRVCSKEMQ